MRFVLLSPCNFDIKVHKFKIKYTLPTDKENELNKVKTLLATKKLPPDHFKSKKRIVEKMYNITKNQVTNAWLKCYEILNFFKFVSNSMSNECEFVHFDNASLPGTFIFATNHYIQTKTNFKYTWFANSLLESSGLGDSFNLMKRYPKNWVINTDGDVTNLVNIFYWKTLFQNTVDLYTSDLGMEKGENNKYELQEYTHVKPNIAQILVGLYVLKNNGSMFIKIYTTYLPITISLILLLTDIFKESYICKPDTSRKTNSEQYLVFKNFDLNNPKVKIIKELFAEKLKCFNMNPFLKKSFVVNSDTFKQLSNFQDKTTEIQIKSIKNGILEYENYNKNGYKDYNLKSTITFNNWLNDVNIIPIKSSKNI